MTDCGEGGGSHGGTNEQQVAAADVVIASGMHGVCSPMKKPRFRRGLMQVDVRGSQQLRAAQTTGERADPRI